MSGRGNGIIRRYGAFPFFVIFVCCAAEWVLCACVLHLSLCCILVYCTRLTSFILVLRFYDDKESLTRIISARRAIKYLTMRYHSSEYRPRPSIACSLPFIERY